MIGDTPKKISGKFVEEFLGLQTHRITSEKKILEKKYADEDGNEFSDFERRRNLTPLCSSYKHDSPVFVSSNYRHII